MNMHTLNLWAILAATISAFVIGWLWYAPFSLGSAWKRANGLRPIPRLRAQRDFQSPFC